MTQPAMTAADLEYVRDGFVSLEQACSARGEDPARARALIEAGRLPRPSYTLPDGTAMVPRDHFSLLDSAGGVDTIREHFLERYRTAGGDASAEEEEWAAYLSGAYGVCLRNVTPEHIVRKEALVGEIDGLLGAPRAADAGWRTRLRAAVDELDGLERPFAPDYDRARWGPSSRDRCITGARRLYPEVFAGPAPSPVAASLSSTPA